MKKILYLFLALCFGAALMTSCKSNNPDEPGKYVVVAKLHSHGTSNKEALESYNKILASMKANGYDVLERVEIITNDTTKMIADIKAVGKTIKEEVGSVTGYFTIEFCGIEEKYADHNDKEHAWKLLDIVEMGKQSDGDYDIWYFSENTNDIIIEPSSVFYYYLDAWAYGITTESTYYSNYHGDTDFAAGEDLNEHCGSGSAYIYPVLKTDGDGVWNPDHASQYITDVIVIYGGGQPESIVIDGRTYRQEVGQDLNDGAHGAYIYFYATRDYYDGRYLWLGGKDHDESGNLSCRVLYNDSRPSVNFEASRDKKDPWNANGYDVVERIVQAYDTHGNPQGDAEFNKDAGGAFIKMIFSYRKH